MRIRTILAAAAVPAALAAAMLGTAASASAATQASSSDVSAYYYNPSGNALGGPQAIGPFGSAHASFAAGPYLAKVTEKVNNADINRQTITIRGTLDQGTIVTDQPNSGDLYAPPTARIYFEGSGGGVSDGSPDGYMGQHWWARGSLAVLSLNSGQTSFTLTVSVDPNDLAANWSDWNGQPASANAALFSGAASHVRNIGLSFGGGWFFENGVTGTGGLTITSITVG
jgi:hypothetical protein